MAAVTAVAIAFSKFVGEGETILSAAPGTFLVRFVKNLLADTGILQDFTIIALGALKNQRGGFRTNSSLHIFNHH